MSCERIGRKRLWLLKDRLNAAQARTAARQMESLELRRTPLWEAMGEEKQWMLACFREWYRDPSSFSKQEDADEGEERPRNPLFYTLITRVTIRGFIRGYADYMDRNIADLHHPYPMRRPEPIPENNYFLGIFDPDFSFASVIDGDDHAQNLLLMTAFALRAYRMEHGTYPQRLAELVPAYLNAVPQDPFALHKPLGYRVMKGRYLLYSIGPDARDDSGSPIDQPREASPLHPRARYSVHRDSKGDIVAGVNP